MTNETLVEFQSVMAEVAPLLARGAKRYAGNSSVIEVYQAYAAAYAFACELAYSELVESPYESMVRAAALAPLVFRERAYCRYIESVEESALEPITEMLSLLGRNGIKYDSTIPPGLKL